MCGGLVEYVSMLIGMRQVWLVVLAVYLLAWLVAKAIEKAVRVLMVRAKFDSLLGRVGVDTALQQLGDGPAAVLAVVEGAVVDVHPDEAVGQAPVQPAAEALDLLFQLTKRLELCFGRRRPLVDHALAGVLKKRR